MVDLKLATMDQIVEEIKGRGLPMMLLVGHSPEDLKGGEICSMSLYEENMPNPWSTYSVLEQFTEMQRRICRDLEEEGITHENYNR